MINIDFSSVLAEFQYTPEEVRLLRQIAVKVYVEDAYANMVELANKRLGKSRGSYLGGLTIQKESEFIYNIVLKGKFPNMLEQGATPFDMKAGFSKSSKVKFTKNGGWYITIPMLFKTTAASQSSGEAGQILPRKIYDLIRNSPSTIKQVGNNTISTLQNGDIPNRYQPTLANMNRTADQYLPKSSIYAGLIRKQDNTTGKSAYNTFRRISNNSDPKSWMHPGIQAYNLMDEAMKQVDQKQVLDKALDELFIKI
jgi:hypothetical protein